MIAEPVSVPDERDQREEERDHGEHGGERRLMIVRKIALRTPLMTPSVTCPMT
jgi:hypothetical protein